MVDRRRLWALPAVALVATAAVPVSSAGSTDSGRSAAATQPAPTADRGTSRVGEYTVTLVTGDRVVVTYAPGQTPQARVVSPGGGGYDVRREGDDVYVVPTSATAALAADRVDEQLFNVTGLVEQGYHDAATEAIPLIASYRPRLRSHPAPPAGAREVDTLPSIHADVLRVAKSRADDVWRSLRASLSTRQPDLVKVWLDAKVRSTLDQSVPLVGAPEVWAAGFDGTGATVAVLDSGIDAEHPDLVGAVTASENFTTDATVDDGSGHGTHVASTIAGTGAASDGANTGVAPGADLLVGKVLNNYGIGELSWIVAGMEWAAAQGADVVNLSIGQDEATGCDDPMAQAVDRLSASTDTLFVIAAGNLGGPSETVTSPGCAATALTVGAVELDGSTAWFSSQGPVPNSHAVKPDIVAPGVDITAAKAGGRGDQAPPTRTNT